MGRSDKTRQRLFDATMELIGEKGYAASTVDEIVERAGVAKGTVYYHFKSKAELVEAMISQQLLAESVRKATEGATDPTDRIRRALTAVVVFIRDNHDFAKLLITEMWREDRIWRESLMLLKQGAIEVIREAIEDGAARGDFSADRRPDIAASMLFYMAATTALDWRMLEPERAMEDVTDEVCTMALGALRP